MAAQAAAAERQDAVGPAGVVVVALSVPLALVVAALAALPLAWAEAIRDRAAA
jgi:hypothetical protein